MNNLAIFRAACDLADRRILWPVLRPVLLPLARRLL
jgi:hypothetical protein